MSISKMLISTDLFLNVLSLPADTRIISASIEYPYIVIEFIVEHPDIPDDSRTVIPEFISEYAEGCNHLVEVKMVSWGSRT